MRAAHPWRAPLLTAVFLLNLVAVVALWWTGSGARTGPDLADELNAAGRMTGLVGTYLVLVQLILRTHVPWLVAAFGKDSLRRTHTWNAYLVVALLAAHGLIQLVGYAMEEGVGVADELGRLIAHYEGVAASIAGLLLLVALTAIAVLPIGHRLPWPTWRAIHLYAYVAVALSLPHQVVTGLDFAGAPLAVAYWSALYAAVIAILVAARAPALWRNVRAAVAGRDVRSWPRAASAAAGATVISMYLLISVQITPLPLDVPEANAPAPLEAEGATPGPEGTASAPELAAAAAIAGEYVGDLVETPYGDAQVRIVVSAGRLVDVMWEVRPGIQRTSWQISDAALPWLSKRAVRAQSAEIDVITGATYTSKAFMVSLEGALREAGIGQRP